MTHSSNSGSETSQALTQDALTQDVLTIEAVIAKQAIHDLNARYCRAVDRCDTPLMQSIWHPDATVDVGVFAGSAADYAEIITQPNDVMERSFHAVTNELYNIDGEAAEGEAYVTAAVTLIEDGEKVERLVGGRYIDKFVKHDSQWKFYHRLFVVDWSNTFNSEQVWRDSVFAMFTNHGSRGREDLSYSRL